MSRRRLSISFALIVAVAAIATIGTAYVRTTPKNRPLTWSNYPISWRLSDRAPSGIEDDSWRTAVQAAFDSWERAPGSRLRFDRRGDTDSRRIRAQDHLVYFDGANTSGLLLPGVIAVTLLSYDAATGRLSDADIVLNDRDFSFTYTGEPGAFDIEDVLAHEVGHFVGLDHSPSLSATMWPYAISGEWHHRSLSADDLAGAAAIRDNGNRATLQGSVRRANGGEVDGAVVAAVRADDGRLAGSALSDSNGRWEIAGLEAGNFHVYATPLEGAMGRANLSGKGGSRNFATTFYGGFSSPTLFSGSHGSATSCGALQVAPDADLFDATGNPVRARGGERVRVPLWLADTIGTITVSAFGPYLSVRAVTGPGPYWLIDLDVAPGAPIGCYDLFVKDAGNQLEAVTGVVEVIGPAPEVHHVEPSSAASRGGETVVVRGSGFQEDAIVLFGGEEGVAGVVTGPTEIEIDLPRGTAGSVDVTVHNRDGQSAVLEQGFTFVQTPEFESLFPIAGNERGGTAVILEGRDLAPQVQVLFGGTPATVIWESPRRAMLITPPHGQGPVDLVLRNPLADDVVVGDAYAFVAEPDPVVSGVVPSTAPVDGGIEIQLLGKNLGGVGTVNFVVAGDPREGKGLSAGDPGRLLVKAPAHRAGRAEVRVVLPNGQGVIAPGRFVFEDRRSEGRSSGGGGCGGLALRARGAGTGTGDAPVLVALLLGYGLFRRRRRCG